MEEKKRAATKNARIEAEKQARVSEKKAVEKALLKKKQTREKSWTETENKLRALKLAKEKNGADSAAAANEVTGKKQNRKSLMWYLKQITIGCTVLLIALSVNAVLTVIHFNLTSILIVIGSGFLALWLIARFLRSGSVKN